MARKVQEPGIVEELGIKVGDFFVESWGYRPDQRELLQGGRRHQGSVKIVEIAKSRVNSTGHSDKVVPVPDVVLERGSLAGYSEQRPMPVTKSGPARLPGQGILRWHCAL